jgi:hypothetical protein
MTFPAPVGVDAAVHIRRAGHGLRRGYRDPGDHGQRQEEADRRASTT